MKRPRRKSAAAPTAVPTPARRATSSRPLPPVRLALDYSFDVLRQLSRLKSTMYFATQGSAEPEVAKWLGGEVIDACHELVTMRNTMRDWLDRTRAHLCLRAAARVTQDVGRLAFRLRRVVLNIVSTWVAPLLKPPAIPKTLPPSLQNFFKIFPSGVPPRQFMLDLNEYLVRIDVTSLLASADMLLAQIPQAETLTRNQTELLTFLKTHGPHKRNTLADGLKTDASGLYSIARWGLSDLMHRGIVENGDLGYFVVTPSEAPPRPELGAGHAADAPPAAD